MATSAHVRQELMLLIFLDCRPDSILRAETVKKCSKKDLMVIRNGATHYLHGSFSFNNLLGSTRDLPRESHVVGSTCLACS